MEQPGGAPGGVIQQGGQPPQARPPMQGRPDEGGRQLLAKSREMVPQMKDKWNTAMMEGGKALHQAALADSGAIRQQDLPQNKFETSLEDFHSVLDQMELNLRCALETTNQCQSSQRYMPTTLTYPQYIATAKQQVGFTSDIRQMLKQAAQDIVDHSVQQN